MIKGELGFDAIPSKEAITQLKRKLRIPTQRWDDYQGAIQAKAFTVAGAQNMAMLADFHDAINDAIANGTTLNDFRKDFDRIVDQYGWTYKGQRGWRSATIFNTNMRSSRMAGKWEQIQRTKQTRPFIQYLTANDSRVRDEHAQWHGLILPADDPWWQTHYPPNGWGCRCTVRSLNQRQLDKMGRKVDSAPSIKTTERRNERTGEIYGDVPEGIDTGWDYNVGEASMASDIAFGEQVMRLPNAVRRKVLANNQQFEQALNSSWQAFVARVLKDDANSERKIHTVGLVPNEIIDHANDQGIPIKSALITTTDDRLARMRRDKKLRKNIAITEADLKALPKHLNNPDAIYYDTQSPAYLYVVNSGKGTKTKFVMEVLKSREGREAGKKINARGAWIISSSRIRPQTFNNPRYVKIK